jgi:hypothetical protein
MSAPDHDDEDLVHASDLLDDEDLVHASDLLDDDELDEPCCCEDGCEHATSIDGVLRCDDCGGLA